jgi:hypothetical protein
MLNQPSEIKVDDNLTWESARVDPFLSTLECPPPFPTSQFFPQWYRDIKGDLRNYRDDKWRYDHTARYCKGLQGMQSLGWTIPLPVDITSEQNVISRKIVVPEMLYGTMWNNKDKNGEHVWDLTVVFWPWRARVKKGWRVVIMPYPLDWSPDWFTFSGAPPGNHAINAEKNGIGNMYSWEKPLDVVQYDYYNLDSVHAFKRNTTIQAGTVVFTAVVMPSAK